MNRPLRLVSALSLLALAVGPVRLAAVPETEAAAGRELLKRYADAVIGVELVVTAKTTIPGGQTTPREIKVETNGTVISAAGLTVTSLSRIDPRMSMEAMRSTQNSGMTIETEFKEVKLRLGNGTEIPAKVVLRDFDLDLAFIAPDGEDAAAGRTYTWINLETPAEGAVLGDYFTVTRADKTLQRVPMVREATVLGVVEKPRRLYLGSDLATSSPVLDPQGRILGLCVQYFANGRTAGIVILPAGDVAEIAKQAETAGKAQPAPTPAPAPATPAAAPAGG